MSITLTTEKDDYEFSNGEWYAITAMGAAFGEIDTPWNGCHDMAKCYSKEQLEKLAMRARQIGKSAETLEMMAVEGGIVSAR
jgi:hypothetical protein